MQLSGASCLISAARPPAASDDLRASQQPGKLMKELCRRTPSSRPRNRHHVTPRRYRYLPAVATGDASAARPAAAARGRRPGDAAAGGGDARLATTTMKLTNDRGGAATHPCGAVRSLVVGGASVTPGLTGIGPAVPGPASSASSAAAKVASTVASVSAPLAPGPAGIMLLRPSSAPSAPGPSGVGLLARPAPTTSHAAAHATAAPAAAPAPAAAVAPPPKVGGSAVKAYEDFMAEIAGLG
jgi:hypothetical protein